MSTLKSDSWLFLYIRGSVAFPELLLIDTENAIANTNLITRDWIAFLKNAVALLEKLIFFQRNLFGFDSHV